MRGAAVELHVPDFERVLEFYRLLGFETQWREPNYLVLGKEEQLLCFYGGTAQVQNHSFFSRYPANTPRGYGVEVIIFDSGIEERYLQMVEKVNIVAPLTQRAWGAKDFRVEDPFGYYLRISEPYDIARKV